MIARSPNTDLLAGNLGAIAGLARRMPPSWDGALISIPVCSADGRFAARALPGRGLYLPVDLRALGISRTVPHVFERSPVAYLSESLAALYRDRIGDRFNPRDLETCRPIIGGAITTYDAIINARAAGKAFDVAVSKSTITTVANTWAGLFLAGGLPAAGTYTAIPGGAVMTRASTGAWSFGLVNPTAPDKKYLLTLGFTSAQILNMAILADLLVAAGTILLTTAAAQTVNSTALTRYTSGAGVLMTFEITTQASATAHNITVNKYTDQDGNTLNTTGAQAGINGGIVRRLTPTDFGPFMGLANGDYGVRSVEEFTCSAALAAGQVALNLYFPLCFMPGIAQNVYAERDSTIQIDGLTELVQSAGGVLGCLTAYALPNTTSTGIGTYFLRTCDG